MKKTFKLSNLDCASCAAKMESAIKKIKGVSYVSISFLMQKLTIEADASDFNRILKESSKICRRIEPDCVIDAVVGHV